MEIWLKQDDKAFRFAVVPPEYEVTDTHNNTSVNINALGEINLIGKGNLKTVPLSSFFPKRNYYFCQYTGFPTPIESVDIITNMKNKGVLRLTMTGTPINMDCTIESFVWGENDGTKDIKFTMEFKEYQKPKVTVSKQEVASNQIVPATTERVAKAVESTTYTVAKGDTLSGIAKKVTGTSSNWQAIYNQNKSVIGGNPNVIYPGQRLVISI